MKNVPCAKLQQFSRIPHRGKARVVLLAYLRTDWSFPPAFESFRATYHNVSTFKLHTRTCYRSVLYYLTRRAQLYDPAYATHIIWYWVPRLYDDPFWMRKTCFHDVRTRSRVKLKRRNALIKLLFTNYHNIQRGLPTRYRARVDRVRCATRVRHLYAVFIHEWTIRINGFSFLKLRAYSVLHGRRL